MALIPNQKVPPRFVLGLPESDPDVVTTYTVGPCAIFITMITNYNQYYIIIQVTMLTKLRRQNIRDNTEMH